MNQVIDTILRRRSWRSYEEKQITQEQLDQVLECGLWAPSAKNEQSWHFTVLQNKELIAQLTAGCQQMMGSETDPFYGAPTLILVTGKEDCIAPMKDGSLAMQNMFLAAESLGLGTCWINCIGRYLTTPQGQEFGARVGVPQGYAGVGCVVLGYPKGQAPLPKERLAGTVNIVK